MNVPFCRPLIRGSRGTDVIAHKRALSRWDPHVYPWQHGFTDFYGPYFDAAVREFQHRHDIAATGKLGGPTHEALERAVAHGTSEPAFDHLAVQLATDFCAGYTKTPEQKIREAIIEAGWFMHSHRAQIAYSQARPMQLVKPPRVLSRADCSGFTTECHYAGGARDPNNRGFDGQGYTGTLSDSPHSRRVGSVQELEPGDLIFYGYTVVATPAFPIGSATHVALYVGVVNGVHSVLSLGSFPMKLYPYDYRPINSLRAYDVVPPK